MVKLQKHGYCPPVYAIHLKEKQRGVAAVEFAFVLPVLVLLIAGIVELGIALYDKAVITNASREGARAGVVLKSTKLTATDIQNVVLNYTSGYLVTFVSSSSPPTPTVAATNYDVASGKTATAPVYGTFGNPLTVSVSYTYTGLLLGPMLSALTGPITLTATTVMNNE
jgi:Flp pilus assembly protein TadG